MREARHVVDGHEFADLDSNLAGDGKFPPFHIFDIGAQDYLPGAFNTRAEAEREAERRGLTLIRAP